MSNHSHLCAEAPWKVAVATPMKAITTTLNPWLASAFRADPAAFQPYVNQIAKCKV